MNDHDITEVTDGQVRCACGKTFATRQDHAHHHGLETARQALKEAAK